MHISDWGWCMWVVIATAMGMQWHDNLKARGDEWGAREKSNNTKHRNKIKNENIWR
jgi:hypothetical protein